MPIRWSAVQVAEAMDEVEALINQAEPFLAEAEEKARQAKGIWNLPEYMGERLGRLKFTIERRQDIRLAIARIREDIPQGALEAERNRGPQQQLSLS